MTFLDRKGSSEPCWWCLYKNVEGSISRYRLRVTLSSYHWYPMLYQLLLLFHETKTITRLKVER
jgi:hypothetical protein